MTFPHPPGVPTSDPHSPVLVLQFPSLHCSSAVLPLGQEVPQQGQDMGERRTGRCIPLDTAEEGGGREGGRVRERERERERE